MEATIDKTSTPYGLETIHFNDYDEYKKFCQDVAAAVAQEMTFNDELAEDIAYEIATRHMSKLANAVFRRLIERVSNEQEKADRGL